MSLDLSISRKSSIRKSGTGVHIRKDGQIVELKTLEEVREHFPDADLSGIAEHEYETYDVFDRNITHNLTTMARNVPCAEGTTLYNLLWHPEDSGFTKVTTEYRDLVTKGLAYMLCQRKYLAQFNPSNGWGSFDLLLDFVYELCNSLSCWDGEEEWEISAYT